MNEKEIEIEVSKSENIILGNIKETVSQEIKRLNKIKKLEVVGAYIEYGLNWKSANVEIYYDLTEQD